MAGTRHKNDKDARIMNVGEWVEPVLVVEPEHARHEVDLRDGGASAARSEGEAHKSPYHGQGKSCAPAHRRKNCQEPLVLQRGSHLLYCMERRRIEA